MILIDVLPDDVLLGIFDFYVINDPWYTGKKWTESWQSLVHVCRRWRNLVFGSPRRLNLQLYCTPETPARDTLDIWPALPLIIKDDMVLSSGMDNIIVALGQSNRVCEVGLYLAGRQLAQMQVPFPELTDLRLSSYSKTPPVIPDSFLGGSAPRLRIFDLSGIPFPGLPKVLLSATHLVHLHLERIPHSGYISPEAMAALLSVSSCLKSLSLGFQSPQSHPDQKSRSLPPPKRSILPTLDEFRFKGVTEYLEELVTRIDTPQLDSLLITFFNQIDFDCPRLAQIINCTPTLRVLDEAHVQFNDSAANVKLQYRTSHFLPSYLRIDISCREPDWQLSSIEQVCNSSLHSLSAVEDLYVEHEYSKLVWKNDAIENTLWLGLLLPFTSVKNLYLSKEFAPGIAAALQELVGSRITEVLPNLQNIFVERLEPSRSFHIGQFVAARQLSDHPITISVWEQEITELFKIPRKFKPEYSLLLQASEADFARGVVQTIKCRLCPYTKLKNFEEFNRHCKTTEAHPLQIHFCDRCGDFFARRDSLKRHRNQPPTECHKVTPVRAAEKRRVTEEAHQDFIRRLEHGLVTGSDIGRPFSQIMKEKYPKSSKKRTGGSSSK